MKQKLNMAMTLAVIFSMLFTAVAFADNVVNNIDTTIDSDLEIRTITAGGFTTVGFYIDPTTGGGDAGGCNATGSDKAYGTLSVPSGVTASQTTNLEFVGCGSTNAVNVTFSSNTPGSYTIQMTSVTGGKPGSQWNLAPSAFTLVVNPAPPSDTTSPVITPTILGTLGSNGWYVSDVTVSWTVVDNESTPTYSCPHTTIDADTAGTTVSCTATSAGGTSSASVTIKRDATAPTVTITPDRGPDYGGWYNSSVNFTVSGTDATSGVASCDADFAYSTPDSETASVNASCEDNAGNVGAASYGFKYDGTPPTISYTVTPAPAVTGWYNIATGAPEVVFTCADATAGIESCTDPYTFGEGADQSYTGTAKDNAGNAASATVSGINVDLTAPTVALVGGPADGASYYFGFVPAEPTCTASDALSGLDGACSVTGYGVTVGSHTVTASAKDMAGNTASASAAYTVQAWTLFGFYQPVDMNGVWNTVKGGATVPLKFEIFAGPTELTSTSFIQSLQAYQVACSGGGSEDPIETVATGGTSLRYDTTSGQFIYNWQTPKKPGTCYKVTMTTQDGSFLTAFFKLK